MIPIKSVRIGPYDVEIAALDDAASADAYGTFAEQELRIAVRPKFSSRHLEAETLLHEILHALWSVQHIPGEHDQEERAVSLLSTGLAQVIRDNPRLIEWLSRTLRGKR